MSLINRGKKRIKKDKEDAGSASYRGPNRIVACLRGVLKVVRGCAAIIPGFILGACGVGGGDILRIINAPIGDWLQLSRAKIKEVNQKRGWGEKIGRGVLGFLLIGPAVGAANAAKDIILGGLQLAGGGVGILNYLNKKGVTPAMMDAIMKTGNPFGYLYKVVGRPGIEFASNLFDKLNADLESYKSLDDVAAKVQAEINANPDLKSIMDKVQSESLQSEALSHVSPERLSELTETVGEGINERVGAGLHSGLTRASGELHHIKTKAQHIASRGVDYRKQIANLYKRVEKELPEIQRALTEKLGIPKEFIRAEKDSVMIKGEDAARGVKALLEDKASKFKGLLVKANSKEEVIEGLIRTDDADLVSKLEVVKIKSEDGSEQTLSKTEVRGIIDEVQKKLRETVKP